ncbi:MAG: DUF2784 domain-containing protein [Longimicrobiales bacterium]
MLYRFLADVTVVVHGLFIVFVVFGGLAVARWPRVAWGHVPCAVWGALIEFAGWICPLTPLENHFRRLAGQEGYPGGFIETYLIPLIYPGALTREIQIALGVGVIVVNVAAYGWALRARRAARS